MCEAAQALVPGEPKLVGSVSLWSAWTAYPLPQDTENAHVDRVLGTRPFWRGNPMRRNLILWGTAAPSAMALHGKGQFENLDKRRTQIRA
jgi:hypothetical protein